jgi:hypothetical protein
MAALPRRLRIGARGHCPPADRGTAANSLVDGNCPNRGRALFRIHSEQRLEMSTGVRRQLPARWPKDSYTQGNQPPAAKPPSGLEPLTPQLRVMGPPLDDPAALVGGEFAQLKTLRSRAIRPRHLRAVHDGALPAARPDGETPKLAARGPSGAGRDLNARPQNDHGSTPSKPESTPKQGIPRYYRVLRKRPFAGSLVFRGL